MSSKESSARPSDFVGSIKNAAMKVLEPPSSDKYRKVEHLILVVGGAAFTTYVLVRAVQAGPQAVLKSVVGSVISVASAVPGVRGAIDKQIEGSLKGVEHEVLGDGDDETAITIPTKSRSHDEVIKLTQKYGVSDSFQGGKSLGGIYYELQGDMSKTHAAMWAQFSKTNALFPALFRGVRRMESELLAMILSMLTGGSRMAPALDSLPSTTTSGSQAAAGGASSSSSLSAGEGDAARAKLVASAEDRERIDKEDRANRALPWVESNPVLPFAERQPSLHGEGLGELCGIVTSGGTESIALAIRAYQAQGEAERGIAREHANIVCSQSAHAALDKACHFYGIQLRKIPVDENMQLDPAKAEKLIDSNTLCIFGSAVSFPHGVADDIPALGQVAIKHGVGLHSDNCLGGVLLSAMRGAGIQVPQFDFAVPGVTTMSVDVHKYGLASKGASVVAFRTRNLRCHVFSAVTDWSGGFYTTPTAQGSRSGGAIAQAWGSLVRMGQEGYVSMARRVHALVTQLATEIPKIPGLKLLGRPDAAVVAFGSTGGFNIYAFATRLKEKHGFGLPTLQKPSGLHVCVTLRLEDCVEEMLGAMRECAAYCGEHPEEGAKGAAGVYGTTFALPDGEVEKTLKLYDEMILAVKPGSKHPLWRERK